MPDVQERLASIKKQYEKIKNELTIKKHDLDKMINDLSEMKIKDLKAAEKKIIEIEKDLKAAEIKMNRLLEKAEKLLASYQEE